MKRPLAAAGWCLLVFLPVLTGLLRLVGHPGAFFDGEASIPATIGRELHLCGADLVFHYQVVAYQGSLVLDSLLSSAGYALFGDHLLAWHVVPLLWLLLASVAGTWLLHRSVGPAGAVAWPLLLATAPFVVRDGLVSGIGAHAAGPGWGLAALAVAVAIDRDRRRSWAIAAVAGAVLAFGTWHVRSAALAGPAVVLLCARGGWRAVGGLFGGLLLFPLLIAGNLYGLLDGTFWAGAEPGKVLARIVLPGGQEVEHRSLLDKAGEAFGWRLGHLLFMQPMDWQGPAPVRPGSGPVGRLVTVCWSLGLASLVGVAGLFWRRGGGDERRALVPVLGVIALVMAWPLAYLVRDFTVEQSVLALLEGFEPGTPGPTISAMRYLVPIYVCVLLGLAAAVGLTWRGRWGRVLGLAVVAPPLLLGGWFGATDWLWDRDAPGLFDELDPFFYPGIALPGRVPPPEVHLRCLGEDPSSLRYHVQALARTSSRGLGPLENEPEVEGQALMGTIVAAGDRLGPDGRLLMARTFGRSIGEEARGRPTERRAEGVRAALEAWTRIEPAFAAAWFAGFVDGFDPELSSLDRARQLEALCAPLTSPGRPEACSR